MLKQNFGITRKFSINFYAGLIISSYFFLQLIRWPLYPLFMDIYYHLHTALGFIQAGGYSGWDFWEYAPFGRVHIYPPFFHILLSFFIKFGADKIILVKSLEVLLPVLFLIVLWLFVRRNYSEREGLFILVMFSSSLSFYLSLTNHLPATLGFILGILSLDQLFRRSLLRASLLLALSFYTHIGVSWFFALGLILFALFDSGYRKESLWTVFLAIFFSLPIVFKQLRVMDLLKVSDLKEKYLCEFKTLDYILALIGIRLSWRLAGRHRLFLSLFLSSFIFLRHPFRFFSAEGYLPIIFLSALSLNKIYERLENKKASIRHLRTIIVIFFLLVSPTLSMQGVNHFYNFDSAIMGMLFPEHNKRVHSLTLWYPNDYLPTVNLIKENSQPEDIIYSPLPVVSVCLASLSGRFSADGLFPDIAPVYKSDPMSVSRIFIALKEDDSQNLLNKLIEKYKLIKIGENKIFIVYQNHFVSSQAKPHLASVSFKVLLLIGVIVVFLFCKYHF